MLLLFAVALLTDLDSARAQVARIDVFVDNDATGANYRDASWGQASGGDFLRLARTDKMPVESGHAYRGHTSGLIEYQHQGGSWDMVVARDGWRPADASRMDTLVVFLNGPEGIVAGELPRIGLEDENNIRSGLVDLSPTIAALDGDPETWQRVAIPLDAVPLPPDFRMDRFKAVRFAHGGTSGEPRTIWVDFIHLIGWIDDVGLPEPPSNLRSISGDRSVILRWDAPAEEAAGYRVFRRYGDAPFEEISPGAILRTDFVDVYVENGVAYEYVVRSLGEQNVESVDSEPVAAHPGVLSDEEFTDLVQQTAFEYFWEEADTTTGQVRDRTHPHSACSIAATGMGLTALTIGIDRGWISREEGRERVLTTLKTLWERPQNSDVAGAAGYRGFFYHFLDCATATRAGGSELSTIDTALLMGGVLHVAEYFDEDGTDPEIRQLAEALYDRVEWSWLQTG
ncbi:MAG: hypothetical protein ACOCTG_06415, partial [Bacteroidota bacterium]